MLDYDLIRDNISKIAHHKNITISELEKKAGLNSGDLCRCENGAIKKITLEEMYATAEALGTTTDTLLYELPKISREACPFCGGEPVIEEGGLEDYLAYYVVCLNCNAHGPEEASPDKAETAWNKRIYDDYKDLYDWRKIFKEQKL